ncbi:hypothetical protein FACS1894132_06860 [Clostridia bacterium]|nr:hypothetical protein FACS1894132_06860 [Clostridia bacterium]
MSQTKKITIGGLLVAIGILLPYFISHVWGMKGNMLLPMHIPVLLAGLLCGPAIGGIAGLLTPFLSNLFTGMPPTFPMLPIMLGELLTYGVVSGLLRSKLKLPVLPSLLIAMVFGRIISGITVFLMLDFDLFMSADKANIPFAKSPLAFEISAVTTGIPGIIAQIILIPAIILALRKYTNIEKCPTAKMAKHLIENNKASCVIVKNDKIIHQAIGNGVKPLLELYQNNADLVKDAFVVDKIIGKAAAMLIVLMGAKKVYAFSMSESGEKYLKAHGIKTDCNEKIAFIKNRAGTGICPLENAVMNIDDQKEGYEKLLETIKEMQNKSGEAPLVFGA